MITTVTMNASVDKRYLVNNISVNEVNRVQEVKNSAGGKGLNVARVLSLLGEEVIATGILGGYNGEYFKSLVNDDKIKLMFSKMQGETRCCINIIDTSTNKSTELLESGSSVCASELVDFLYDYERAIVKSQVVVISGSLPKGVPTDFYRKLIDLAKLKEKKVIVDTSKQALKNAILSKPTVIKPNINELQELFEKDIKSFEDIVEASECLYSQGIEIVVISMGKDGALVKCSEGVFYSKIPTIKVVNTVGCGDSMVAGLALGLLRKYKIQDTMKYAAAASVANAMTMDTGSINKHDFDELLPMISVDKIK